MLWKRLLINTSIGLLLGVIFTFLNLFTPLFHKIELSLYNTRFEDFRGNRSTPDDLVILAIDDLSIEEMGGFPWGRDTYADLLEGLVGYGAKMVAFDIMFATPSGSEAADKKFRDALAKHKDKTMIVSKLDFGAGAKVSGEEDAETGSMAASYTTPYFEGSSPFGLANYIEDVDGQIRRAQLAFDIKSLELLPSEMTMDERYEPTFPFAVLQKLEPDKAKQRFEKYNTNEILINYAGLPYESYPVVPFYVPYLDIMGDPEISFQRLTGERMEAFFKDKIVFVGATAEVLQDTKHTPFVDKANVKMPGVEVHVNTFDTLRSDIAYSQADMTVNTALIFLFAVIMSVALAFLNPLQGLALMAVMIGGYAVVNIGYFFHVQRLFIDLFAPLMVILATYGVTYAYRFLFEEREKRRIRKFFKSYVSPKLVEELLKDPSTMPSLKSERRMVTMLFSDIAGFTSMSESLPPDEVEHILNEYLTAMSAIVFENDGTLDKYIGDAVMAVWGNVGPSNPKTDAYKAVNTAIQMQRTLAELREKWLAEGMVPLQIRIGLNTGEALVGNFGSPQKMDYTVIGDAVNTAARLEGLNKQFGTSILISQSVYDLVSDRLNGRHCGTVKVKGKEEPVSVYEAMSWKDGAGAATEARDTKWIKGTSETQWQ